MIRQSGRPRTGLRVLGPNCPGFINIRDSVCLMMSSIACRPRFEPGGISLVAQSGGVAGVVCERAQDTGTGLGLALCTGNEADVTVGETLQWLARDPDTKVVAGYLEGIRDASEFVFGLEALQRVGKPVVMLKVGATEAGARATEAHTGALAGRDDVVNAVFERWGVVRVFEFDELIDTAECLHYARRTQGRRVGILTTSGGVGTVAAEAAERAGLELPALSERTKALLAQAMPDFASLRNPVDMTAMFQEDLSIVDRCLQAFSDANELDVLILSIAVHAADFAERLADQFIRYVENGGQRPVILWPAGEMSVAARRRLRRAAFAVFEDAGRCMRAVAASTSPAVDSTPIRTAEHIAEPPPRHGTETAVLEIFRTVGVPTVQGIDCGSPEEAAHAARELGTPVVVKASAAGLVHKTEVGAVIVGVDGPQACAQAHDRVVDASIAAGFQPQGSIVQPMVASGFELVVGARRDPDFGTILVIGQGGLGVELAGDVVRRLLPLRVREAGEMIRSLRSYPLLAGYRNLPPADVNAAVEAIEALARFAVSVEDRLQVAEINPLVIHADGEGVTAVDGVLVLDDA